MKKNRIEEFLKLCQEQDKTAFIYKRKKKKSFAEFYDDILKMRSLYEKEIKKDGKVLVFIYPYSYLFYVAIFAAILSGIDLVILDSYKNKNHVKELLSEGNVFYALLDPYTQFLSFKLPSFLKKVQISKFKKYGKMESSYHLSSTITTFTSGTTGVPKAIVRNVDFLMQQIDCIEANLSIHDSDIVYATLPMYCLLSSFLGNTIYLSRHYKENKKYLPTVLLTNIHKILQMKKPISSIKQCFLGGAILYSKEAEHIKQIFPNAKITYVYGASEGALIYFTTLEEYLLHPFTFSNPVEGIEAEIVHTDENGVGEIIIKGDIVLSSNHIHHTGDLGFIENKQLKIVGRKKYSTTGFYNYLVDEQIRKDNPHIKRAFSFYTNNRYYCAYEGRISHKEKKINYIHRKKLPMDSKRKTKYNYGGFISKQRLEK